MYIFIQSMLRQRVGGVFDGGSCGLMVDPLQRGCWSPNDVFGSLQHSVQVQRCYCTTRWCSWSGWPQSCSCRSSSVCSTRCVVLNAPPCSGRWRAHVCSNVSWSYQSWQTGAQFVDRRRKHRRHREVTQGCDLVLLTHEGWSSSVLPITYLYATVWTDDHGNVSKRLSHFVWI